MRGVNSEYNHTTLHWYSLCCSSDNRRSIAAPKIRCGKGERRNWLKKMDKGNRKEMSHFQCQLCGIPSNSNDMLLAHLKECSENQMRILFETNQCNQCGNSFLRKDLLLVHINDCAKEQLENLRQYEIMHITIPQPDNTPNFGNQIQAKHNNNRPGVKEKSTSISDNVQAKRIKTAAKYVPNYKAYNGEESSSDDDRNYAISTYSSNNNVDELFDKVDDDLIKEAHSKEERNDNSIISNESKNDSNDQSNTSMESFDATATMNKDDDISQQVKREHKCNSCEKNYSSRNSLQRHDESVHKGIRHQCNQCEKSFTQKTQLSSHNRLVHGSTNAN